MGLGLGLLWLGLLRLGLRLGLQPLGHWHMLLLLLGRMLLKLVLLLLLLHRWLQLLLAVHLVPASRLQQRRLFH